MLLKSYVLMIAILIYGLQHGLLSQTVNHYFEYVEEDITQNEILEEVSTLETPLSGKLNVVYIEYSWPDLPTKPHQYTDKMAGQNPTKFQSKKDLNLKNHFVCFGIVRKDTLKR
jgi:hypothetical protein